MQFQSLLKALGKKKGGGGLKIEMLNENISIRLVFYTLQNFKRNYSLKGLFFHSFSNTDDLVI